MPSNEVKVDIAVPRRRRLSDESKEKIRKALLAKWRDPVYRQKASIGRRGRVFGPLSEETKQKLRTKAINRKHSDEAKAKMSAAAKDRWRSSDFRIRYSETRKRLPSRPCSAETKKKISEKNTGYKHSEEAKRKMRLATIRRREKQTGRQVYPNWNSRACDFFRKFDSDYHTEGQYATNKGERFLPEVGYWVDYINDEIKLIIEWDEKRHYTSDGKLKKKDRIRQEEIQKLLPDYEFARLRE